MELTIIWRYVVLLILHYWPFWSGRELHGGSGLKRKHLSVTALLSCAVILRVIVKICRFKEFKTNYQWQGSRQRRWNIVTFLLAGTTYSQSYCCTGRTPVDFSKNFESKIPKRRSLKIRHLTASAPHNLKVGGPRAHFNSNIHHLDVRNDVRSLETKFACSKIVIGDQEIVTNSQISRIPIRWNLGVWRSRNISELGTSEFWGAHSLSFTCSLTLVVIGRKNCVTLVKYLEICVNYWFTSIQHLY
jgi:hypothetical protein